MGQEEVIAFLKKCKEPKSRKQIADELGYNPIRVSRILKSLIKFDEVDYIEHDRKVASKKVSYLLMRRTRFYFAKQ